jgi:hypothetical protein
MDTFTFLALSLAWSVPESESALDRAPKVHAQTPQSLIGSDRTIGGLCLHLPCSFIDGDLLNTSQRPTLTYPCYLPGFV